MKLPLGILFVVTSSKAMDIYTSMIHGDVLDRKEARSSEDELAEMEMIEKGGCLWPKVGWTVEDVPGFDECMEIEYVDPYIPAPLGARVSKDVTNDELLYSKRVFKQPSDTNSKILTTNDYHALNVRGQGVIDLHVFSEYLVNYHN